MSKKKTIISLVILTVVGAFFTFYGMNLLQCDISNYKASVFPMCIISTLPIFMIGMQFVAAARMFFRMYRYPESAETEKSFYLVLLTVYAAIGLIASVLTGTVIYGSLTAPYPFAGATIMCIIWHALLAAASVCLKCRQKKNAKKETGKLKAGRIFSGILFGFLLLIAYDRFGAFLWSPVYAQASMLAETIWVFLAMLIPIILFVTECIIVLWPEKRKTGFLLKWSIAVLAATVVLSVVVILLGRKDTGLIAAMSPAFGLERLATMPVTTLIHTPVTIGFAVFFFVRELIKRKDS